jgi:hypothetical protein
MRVPYLKRNTDKQEEKNPSMMGAVPGEGFFLVLFLFPEKMKIIVESKEKQK